MAGEIQITVVGNLTADPELRYTPSGAAVANFTVASTPRVMRNGEWEDGDPTFLRCNVWRGMAENAVESLRRGDRVIVMGKLQQRSYEDKDGNKRSVMELLVDEMGPSVKWHSAKSMRPERAKQQVREDDDPWGSSPPPSSGSWSDEPPFHHSPTMDHFLV